MTKKNDATVNSLDLARLTSAYFHPDVISGDISRMPMPTIEEFKFIGKCNAETLRRDMRHEEKTLRKLLKQATWAFSAAARLAKDGYEMKCDWRGFYAETQHLSCRFGRDVGEWCEKSPDIKNCNCRCCHHTSRQSVVRCASYAVCYGQEALRRETCIFCHADEMTLESCKRYLDERRREYAERLSFAQEYIARSTVAINTCEENKPTFRFYMLDYLQQIEDGSEVLKIEYVEGGINLRRGVFLTKVKEMYEEYVFISMFEGEVLKIPTRFEKYLEYTGMRADGNEFLTVADMNYLISHADYRQVWLRIIEDSLWARGCDLRMILRRFEMAMTLVQQTKD